MPRLFTGIEIPADIAGRLAFHRGGLSGARWIEPSDYHVTLRFLGDVDDATADAMHDALIELRPRGPVPVALAGLDVFGGRKPRAILAAVAPSAALTELREVHERIARRVGLAPEPRKFTPHVTLARLNRSAKPDDVARYMAQASAFARLDFTAARVALFSARASQGGGPYLVEATYPLVGPDAPAAPEG